MRRAPEGCAGRPREWSGKRDSNPRLRPWQGRTLPLSYSRPSGAPIVVTTPVEVNTVEGYLDPPSGVFYSDRPVAA